MNFKTLILATAFALCAPVHALYLDVGAGRANESMCGGPGCWNQPPLPWSAKLDSNLKTIGIAGRNWSATYLDVGRVYVGGLYVLDNHYDPVHRMYRPDPAMYTSSMTTKTRGVALDYVGRWNTGAFELDARAGAFVFDQQDRWHYGLADSWYTDHFERGVGKTFTVGLSAAYRLTENLDVALDLDAFGCVTYREAPVGGMRTGTASLRWHF